jgi:mycothiol system anti-sigma-R factor
MTDRDCNETLRELEMFLDGEMTTEELTIIRAHLEDCPNCHEAFDFHAELKTIIARKCRSDPMPASLLSRIEECFQADLDGDGRIG